MGLGLELIMKICVVSLFPEMVKKILNFGVIGRSEANGIMSLSVINPRDFTDDNYQKVDDKPYGGGPGMVMKYEPLKRSVEVAKEKFSGTAPVILLSPQGARFDQKTAKRFSQYSELIFVCGRYEGIDQRFIDSNVDEEISKADMIFISVNTPTKKKGKGAGQASDLKWIESSARQIAKFARSHTVVVEKSTLPVKTAETIKAILNPSEQNDILLCTG